MNVMFFGGLVFIWLFGTLFSNIMDGALFVSGDADVINALGSFGINELKEGGVFSIPYAVAGFFTSLFKVMTWDYNYLNGDWELMRLPLIVLSAMVAWGIISTFGSSAIRIGR